MTRIQSTSHKNTSFKLSEQVKETLHAKGYSKIFNYQDYKYYKAQVKKAFNKDVPAKEFDRYILDI